MAASDVSRQAVVAAARGWLKTPYAHQGHQRGVGADCGGMVAGVCIGLGIAAADWWEREFAPLYGGYARTPAGDMLLSVCRRFMREIATSAARPADVLLLRFAIDPQHLAIASDYPQGGLAMIHAYSRAGAVVEHRLADVWRARIVAAFALPGVEA